MGAGRGQALVAAGDQTLTRILRMQDLEQVDVVEAPRLQPPRADQLLDRGALQRGDPVDAAELAQLVDPRLGDHAAVADDGQALETELRAQALDLRQQGLGIGDVAFHHRDRHRPAADIAQQAEVDLQLALLPVPAVAAVRQRAVRALEPGRADVVQHQAAGDKMPAGQPRLDPILPGQKPIHRRVEFVDMRAFDVEFRLQGGVLPPARGGELGVRTDDPCRDHGAGQAALPARPGREQRRQSQLAERDGHRFHGAMGPGAEHLEGGLGFQIALALEVSPEQFDGLVGEAREVGHGLLLDAPLGVPVGVAKKLGVVDLAALPAGDDGDMHAAHGGSIQCLHKSAALHAVLASIHRI